jgi:uncharacterized protein YndB with AHSA1/START domain
MSLAEALAHSTEPIADREIVSKRVLNYPRERVFEAFRNPNRLMQWWGPQGFTNTFHEFDLRPGGHWRFVMHGPDGGHFENESIFVEVDAPERIVFDHVSSHPFRMTQTYEDLDGKTRVTWHMLHQSAADCEKVKPYVPRCNEENFDRLEAVLAQSTH